MANHEDHCKNFKYSKANDNTTSYSMCEKYFHENLSSLHNQNFTFLTKFRLKI